MATIFRSLNDFESLGDNCEFGLYQKRMHIDQNSLFRFSFAPLEHLIDALNSRFVDVLRPEHISLFVARDGTDEYMVALTNATSPRPTRRYRFVYHTYTYVGKQDPDQLLKKQLVYLKYWVRKLLETAESGEKIFVCKRNTPVSDEQIRELHLALRAYGPSTLLAVRPADETHPAGSVDVVAGGLMIGYVARFARYGHLQELDAEGWSALCRNAHAKWVPPRPDNAGAPGKPPVATRIRGFVDRFTPPNRLAGWAMDGQNPTAPLAVRVVMDGREIGAGVTYFRRADLKTAATTNTAGFTIETQEPIAPERFRDGCVKVLAEGHPLVLGAFMKEIL